jgi:predicted nucleic acid-binding protein
MIEKIVVNTSPIIALGQMRIFDAIEKLPFEFICPSEVEEEILVGTKQGFPVNVPSFFKVFSLNSELSPLTTATLDKGEAAVIQLALEQNIGIVCIDDLKGRRAAKAVGLEVIGSLGLIGKAKTLGLIKEIRPLIEVANNAGIFYDKNLIETFLEKLGE